jgi:hypothetical protein
MLTDCTSNSMGINEAPDQVERAAPGAAPGSSLPKDLTISAVSARKLSDDLALILHEFEVESVTLREVMSVLHGRGYVLLVMLLALPFSTPIPLPGLSTPFGMVIMLIGVRLALGQKPWLPQRLLDTQLSPRLFVKVFAAARKILRGFEYFLRPRLLWITGSPRVLQLHAVPIVLCSLLLLLPLPIPFSNIFPAFSILLLSAGLLERDGAFILAGHVGFLLSVAFFIFMGIAGKEGVEAVMRWFNS